MIKKTMIFDEISITSHFKSLLRGDFELKELHEDGQDSIRKLLNKSVLVGGKRLRPLLTFLFGQISSVDQKDLFTLAKSIEYVHAASLAHDDVIDNATMRRGKPSINVQSDNKMAVLSGDYLLSEVINDLCLFDRPELVKEMAEIIKRLSLGEWLQHGYLTSRNYSKQSFDEIAIHKTSSVLEWCAVSPFLFAKADPEVISLAREFGHHLGISFQLYDDILDFSETSEKDQQLDLENNQLTYLTFHFLENNNLLEDYKNGKELTKLVDIYNLNASIADTRKKADHHHTVALQSFNSIVRKLQVDEKDKSVSGIKFLLEKLKNRKK